MRVAIRPEMIRWACARARLDTESLAEKFAKLPDWLSGEIQPTLKQLEKFATTTRTPIGYFFLPEPPEERIPIPDLRTLENRPINRPSPDLLDTIYLCEQRQEWYREFAISGGMQPLAFVGSCSLKTKVVQVAAEIRRTLGFGVDEQRRASTWTDALKTFVERADAAGVLVMVNGVVGSNSHRKLDPREFRGFALCDPIAPLVFINGADTKAAQMFTLAHELAHIWLGQTALSDAGLILNSDNEIEIRCNKVAAELLVPLETLREVYRPENLVLDEVNRLARYFKVSTLVTLRRFLDANFISRDELRRFYDEEIARILSLNQKGGGDFYLTLSARLGKRFTRSIIVSTLEGQTLYRDAFRMLGCSTQATFLELSHKLGIE